MTKSFYIYVLTNTYNTVFYTGITNNLDIRLYTHKQKINVNSFTKRYNIWKLIYFEIFNNPKDAIIREKQIKNYRREKKLALIKTINPNLEDLSPKVSHCHFEEA